jgi:hypothetical protein
VLESSPRSWGRTTWTHGVAAVGSFLAAVLTEI